MCQGFIEKYHSSASAFIHPWVSLKLGWMLSDPSDLLLLFNQFASEVVSNSDRFIHPLCHEECWKNISAFFHTNGKCSFIFPSVALFSLSVHFISWSSIGPVVSLADLLLLIDLKISYSFLYSLTVLGTLFTVAAFFCFSILYAYVPFTCLHLNMVSVTLYM